MRHVVTTTLEEQAFVGLCSVCNAVALPRADVLRRIIAGALRDTEAIERWCDALLGPRFDWTTPAKEPACST